MTLPPVTFTDEFVKWVASIEGASVLNRDLARNVLDAREEAERLRAENAKLRAESKAESWFRLLDRERAENERLRAENQTLRSNLETLGLIDPDDIAEGERQAKGGKWVTLVDTREEFWEEGDAAKEAGHD